MAHLIDNPLTRFIAQAVFIIGVSRLIGLLARRFDQPMVVAEIAAGVLLGPSLLGWLAPGLSHAVFTPDSLPLLGMVSNVGLIMFMFLIGLELDPRLLRGRGHTSVVISHTSILVPFALGALVAPYLYHRLSSPDVRFTSFTLFMGIAMSITAFPVLARILSERRLLGSKVGAVTITCAAVDDVTAWCLLAFVVSVARARGVGSALVTVALVLAYIAAMFFLVRPFLARLGARIADREGLSQNAVAVTLLLVLLSSWATELIGIHALFGAFMLGAIMPREGGFVRVLAEKLEDFVLVFMLPLFFAYSGLRTHVGLLNTPGAWGLCALIVALACLGKFGGSAAAARFTGLPWRESSAIGILMNTRGLMELVVLNIGLDLGVISPTLFTMMVLMALVTTFMTSPLLRMVYPLERAATDLATESAEPPEPAAAVAAAAPAPFTVVMCVAFERSGPGMVAVAGALAASEPPASRRLYALRLVRPSERASWMMQSEGERSAGAALEPLLDKARELDVRVRPLSFVSPHPGDDICNVADVKRASLVLLGWHKPLLGQTVLGGTVYQVMRRARADVGVLIDRGLTRVGRVLVPYHGGDNDRAALGLARRLHRAGAAVTILHVVAPAGRGGSVRPSGARADVDQVFDGDADGAAPIEFRAVEHESPADAALAEAGSGYDLVVVGIGHEWGLEQRPFGVQPEQLIRRCPTSLLVVRAHAGAAAAVEPAERAASGGGGAARASLQAPAV